MAFAQLLREAISFNSGICPEEFKPFCSGSLSLLRQQLEEGTGFFTSFSAALSYTVNGILFVKLSFFSNTYRYLEIVLQKLAISEILT